MSDKMRWRYGDTNPVVAAVDAETVIEIGDLVWQDTDDAKPANHVGMANNIADVAREGFAMLFLGVAMQRSRSGDTSPIRVATTGVFEFDCPSGTFELGDFVGVGRNEVNNSTLNQQVVKVSEKRDAIGRVAKRESSDTTEVLVDIRSTVMTGGVR